MDQKDRLEVIIAIKISNENIIQLQPNYVNFWAINDKIIVKKLSNA